MENWEKDDNYGSNESFPEQIQNKSGKEDESHVEEVMVEKIQTGNEN